MKSDIELQVEQQSKIIDNLQKELTFYKVANKQMISDIHKDLEQQIKKQNSQIREYQNKLQESQDEVKRLNEKLFQYENKTLFDTQSNEKLQQQEQSSKRQRFKQFFGELIQGRTSGKRHSIE